MGQLNYHTQAHAKWILTGEHAVLRGKLALVFPVRDKVLTLDYIDGDNALTLECESSYGDTLQLVVWNTLEVALKRLNKNIDDLTGTIHVTSNIPMAGGMGFSAAVCVGVARLLLWKGWLYEPELLEFARGLEDKFHGTSSGVDIAGTLYNQGILYFRNGKIVRLDPVWKPILYLSYSGHASATEECVRQVNDLFTKDESMAQRIDERMAESSHVAERALHTHNAEKFEMLAHAINLAESCFQDWGLVDEELKAHVDVLTDKGAAAVKVSGAGAGGYVLSLWKTQPPIKDIPFELFPVDIC